MPVPTIRKTNIIPIYIIIIIIIAAAAGLPFPVARVSVVCRWKV